MTTEEKKIEAIKRMKLLKLHCNVINDFENNNLLNLSEGYGALYWLDEKQKEHVAEFEQTYNAVVYHVIHNITEFGELLSFLFVSDYKPEWKMDIDDLKHGYTVAYVENLDEPDFSEFGSIGIRQQYGGLVRTA